MHGRRVLRLALSLFALPAAVLIAGCGGAGGGAGAPAAGGSGGADPPINVYPIPGAQVASPQTQITFRGLPIRQVGQIVVTGSRSGTHAGRFYADSDGHGGSFFPDKPFTAGEEVTVKTHLNILGVKHGTFHFEVAKPAGAIPDDPQPPAQRQPGDVLQFRSRPDLTPVAIELTRESNDTAPGDIFLAPQVGPLESGPMILSSDGELLFFQPVRAPDFAANFQAQRYRGKPVLTWWEGYTGAGVGVGEDVIENSAYVPIALVKAGNGLSADLHEFTITPDNTALITAYYPVYWNASSVHGPTNEIVLDSVVQEIDIATGLVLFQWDSLDHVPLNDTYEALPTNAGNPFDYFHVNSVETDGPDKLLISARNTWAAYEVAKDNGDVLWTLGGKKSTFAMGSGTSFAFQHDVDAPGLSDPVVTLFDDGAGPPQVHTQSRAITLRLNFADKSATLLGQYVHDPPLLSSFEGNVQSLSNGDKFVGWGQQAYFSEFNAKGQMIFDARFVDGNDSYRAYRELWEGTPQRPPAVIASTSGSLTTVYMSWNGATTVSYWRVLAGSSPTSLQAITTEPKQGFETEVQIASQAYVAVQALDARGRTLGTSATVPAPAGSPQPASGTA
jgi:Arylsulfotransferase (ASST)